jgi:NAD(P)-dependent dehydrogenase (short-subunit alcohol dehydrogenase family)
MTQNTALIVGASSGIGLGLAQAWLDAGWRVIATIRDDRGEAALAALPGQQRLTIARCDVANQGQIEALARSIKGPLDVVILNAGVIGPLDITAATLDEAERVHRVNALGPARLAFGLIDKVRDRTGVVAFTTSGMGSIGETSSPGYEIYRASKSAQNMFARTLWVGEAKARGITVLSIDPGWVQTAMGGPGAAITVAASAAGIVEQIQAHAGRGDHRFISWRGEARAW